MPSARHGVDAVLPVVDRAGLLAALGLTDEWRERLDRAMCHRSWCAENPGFPSNERLEFLGDSVLGFIVADRVFRADGDLDEGVLTDVRKAVVNAVCLAEVAAEIDLGRHLLLGKGEEQSGGREKPSILADALEAVIGAVYLDHGLDAARTLIDQVLGARIESAIEGRGQGQDHKSKLQELLAAEEPSLRYRYEATGPDHAREFTVTVSLGGVDLGAGVGRSKKQAEQQAARAALEAIEQPGTPGALTPSEVISVPELPEVETIRRQLEREVVGKKIKTVEVKDPKLLRRNKSKKAFAGALEGAKLKSLQRRGGHLRFLLDTGDYFFVDLGPTGQIRKSASKDEMEKGTGLILHPTTGGQVRLIDPKSAAEAYVCSPEDLEEVATEFSELGADLVDTPISWRDFARMVLTRDTKLKALLTDQTIFAGIGPMYADEILHDAGLRHDRIGSELSIQEVRRLSRSVVEKLHDAVKHGGTTMPDQAFLDLHGEAGGFASYHEVYQRDGQACRRCRSTVSKVKFQGRNTYLCEACQV